MRDPVEGVGADGLIVTGVGRARVQLAFEPVLAEATRAVDVLDRAASLYVYGSVATGRAERPLSDVDLLVVNAPSDGAAAIAAELSTRFRPVCRGVEIGVATTGDFERLTDESYGNRVFLRHYCVHVAGPVLRGDAAGFRADARAARGFDGDVAEHADRWHVALAHGAEPATLARRVARKTLLAVAGLVSVHDRTWTTDRTTAAHRWAQVNCRLHQACGNSSNGPTTRATPTPPTWSRPLSRRCDPLSPPSLSASASGPECLGLDRAPAQDVLQEHGPVAIFEGGGQLDGVLESVERRQAHREVLDVEAPDQILEVDRDRLARASIARSRTRTSCPTPVSTL